MAVGFLFYINPQQNSSTSLPLPPGECDGSYAENLKDIDNLVSIDRNIWHLFTYVIEGQQTSFYVNGNLITVSNEASDLGSVSLTWGN